MKKFLSLLLVCAMLGLTACGSGNDDADPTTDEQVENGSEDKNASKEIDWSKYENQANVLCYNIFYQDVADRSDEIQDLILK